MSADERVNRRRFLESAGASVAAAAIDTPRIAKRTETGTGTETGSDRAYWVTVARRLSEPVLTNLAAGTLRARMPVEEVEGAGQCPWR